MIKYNFEGVTSKNTTTKSNLANGTYCVCCLIHDNYTSLLRMEYSIKIVQVIPFSIIVLFCNVYILPSHSSPCSTFT